MAKIIRYSITVLGEIKVYGNETLTEKNIIELISNDYSQFGGDIGYANDVEYEMEEI